MSNMEEVAKALYETLHNLRPMALQYIIDQGDKVSKEAYNDSHDTSLAAMSAYINHLGGEPISIPDYWEELNKYYSGEIDFKNPRTHLKKCSQSPAHEDMLCEFLTWLAFPDENEKPVKPPF